MQDKIERSNILQKKYEHQEKIFSAWGFIISYVVYKGGCVTIIPPKRKKVIDKRNEINIFSIEVEGNIWTEKIFSKQITTITENFPGNTNVQRYLKKDIHDQFMNCLTQWCKIRGFKDGILINTKVSKVPTTNTYKRPNEFISTIDDNGIFYSISEIKAKYGEWLKQVLEYFWSLKSHLFVISPTTLPYNLLNIIKTFGSKESNIQQNQTREPESINGCFESFDQYGNSTTSNIRLILPPGIEEKLRH
ncbi:hypothetical protein ENUP19_0170G0030 [Entamoeba nuttalli]|uniref:Uncharacterized protein n=1 Tax=Entamoeba nuttalli TaxID=412467 RepID=A0ABQ0DMC6_9EUKA